jgi:putative transposase
MVVVEALEEAATPSVFRTPSASIRVATSKELDLWAYTRGITLNFSRPGKPTDNVYIESFNASTRLECPGQHWFMDLDDARPEGGRLAPRMQ